LAQKGREYLEARSDSMSGEISKKLTLVLKYQGSEALINISFTQDDGSFSVDKQELINQFEVKHKKSFGFLIESKPIVIQRFYVDTFLHRQDIDKVLKLSENKAQDQEIGEIQAQKVTYLPFENLKTKKLERMETSIYEENLLPKGGEILGPALVIMNGSTIVVEPGWKCVKNQESNFELFFHEEEQESATAQADVVEKNPIMLSIFG
jgi:5-oxoprolinase (ATP-hydrolysing)